MIWGFFLAASGLDHLTIIGMKMYSHVYQNLLQENVRVGVHQL